MTELLCLLALGWWSVTVVKGIYNTFLCIWKGKMFRPGTAELLD